MTGISILTFLQISQSWPGFWYYQGISILELILLRSRGNVKEVKIFQRIFHPAVDYVF